MVGDPAVEHYVQVVETLFGCSVADQKKGSELADPVRDYPAARAKSMTVAETQGSEVTEVTVERETLHSPQHGLIHPGWRQVELFSLQKLHQRQLVALAHCGHQPGLAQAHSVAAVGCQTRQCSLPAA